MWPLAIGLDDEAIPGVGDVDSSLEMKGKADSALEWLLVGRIVGAIGVPREGDGVVPELVDNSFSPRNPSRFVGCCSDVF